MIKNTPLLVIATYRTEDVPDLPDKLPAMEKILLQRFNPDEIAALSTSMLGESGAQSQVLNLLQDETEGNVFFLVETVRALAEEAGSLQRINTDSLPETVFAGGVQRVIQHRLARLPDEYQPLLKLAAIAGRAIEPDLLHIVFPETNVENWLIACANVAVLEIHDERWRFAHDKFRETLLSNLDSEEKQELNLQVAQSLETIYIDELSPQYGRLAWHYSQTNQQEKEMEYAKLAGELAASQYSHEKALRFFTQAINLTPENNLETRHDILLSQEAIYKVQGNLEKQLDNLETLQQIVITLDDKTKEANLYTNWTAYYYNQSNYPAAVESAQHALKLAVSIGQLDIALKTYNQIASILWRQNNFDEANYYVQTGLT